jgi:hypothetical protein
MVHSFEPGTWDLTFPCGVSRKLLAIVTREQLIDAAEE